MTLDGVGFAIAVGAAFATFVWLMWSAEGKVGTRARRLLTMSDRVGLPIPIRRGDESQVASGGDVARVAASSSAPGGRDRPSIADGFTAYHRTRILSGPVIFVGALIVLGPSADAGDRAAATAWLPIAVVAIVLGTVVAAGVAIGVAWARSRSAPGPRVARVRPPTLEDYVDVRHLRAGRALALLPVVTLPIAVVVPSISVGAAVMAAAASTGLLVASEVGGRRLVDAPQPASGDLELAWEDLLRARVLRDVVSAPAAVAPLVALLVVEPALDLSTVLGLVVLVAVCLVPLPLGTWSQAAARDREVLERLWSREMAALRAG